MRIFRILVRMWWLPVVLLGLLLADLAWVAQIGLPIEPSTMSRRDVVLDERSIVADALFENAVQRRASTLYADTTPAVMDRVVSHDESGRPMVTSDAPVGGAPSARVWCRVLEHDRFGILHVSVDLVQLELQADPDALAKVGEPRALLRASARHCLTEGASGAYTLAVRRKYPNFGRAVDAALAGSARAEARERIMQSGGHLVVALEATGTALIWSGVLLDIAFVVVLLGWIASIPLAVRGTRWRLRALRGQCRCGYDLTALDGRPCPECGRSTPSE